MGRWLIWVQNSFLIIEYLCTNSWMFNNGKNLLLVKLNFCQLWWVKLISNYDTGFVCADILLKGLTSEIDFLGLLQQVVSLVWLLNLLLLLMKFSKYFKCELQHITGILTLEKPEYIKFYSINISWIFNIIARILNKHLWLGIINLFIIFKIIKLEFKLCRREG